MKLPFAVKRVLGVSPAGGRYYAVLIEKNVFSSNWRLTDAFETPAGSLASVLRQKRFFPDELAISIPATELVRPLTFPLAASNKLDRMARFEVQGLFPKNVDVACAQAILKMDDRNIHAIVAAVEKSKLSTPHPISAGLPAPDVLLTDSLSIYQLLRAEEALLGRTLHIHLGPVVASLLFTENDELRFLRSYVISEMPDLASEFYKVIEHIQKKYASGGIDRLLWIGPAGSLFDEIAARFPTLKPVIYTHPDLKSPEFLPALGVALSLLPNGLGLNFISQDQRRLRYKERTQTSRAVLAALPAVLILLSANAADMLYKLKTKELTREITRAEGELSAIEKEVAAVHATYKSNQTLMELVRESDIALGGNTRWSRLLSDLARLVPAEVTLEKIATPFSAASQKYPAALPNAKRSYAGMNRPISESAQSADPQPVLPANTSQISIEGYSFDFDAIHRFFENLESSGLFQNIHPKFEIVGSTSTDLLAPTTGKILFSVDFSLANPARLAMQPED